MRKSKFIPLVVALAATLPGVSFATTTQPQSTPFVGATTKAGSTTGAAETDVTPSQSTASGLQSSTSTVSGAFIPSQSNQPGPTNPVPGGNAYLGYGADASGSDANGDIGANNTAVGTGATSSDMSASTPGSNNTALGSGATAVDGQNTTTGGTLAVGSNAQATGLGATAVGPGAQAGNNGSGGGGTALGAGAQAGLDGTPSTALGNGAQAQSGSLAIGIQPANGAYNGGQGAAQAAAGSVAIYGNAGYADPTGNGNNNGIQSIAIEGNAGTVAGASNGAISIGAGSNSNALAAQPGDFGSTVIGAGAQGTGVNSIVLGAMSTDGGQANVLSIGSASQQRTIINVAPGVNGTDGVNVSQLPGLWGGTASNPVFTFGANAGAFGGGSPVIITNVAPGAVTATSSDAVNGAQLYGVQQNLQGQINTLQQSGSAGSAGPQGIPGTSQAGGGTGSGTGGTSNVSNTNGICVTTNGSNVVCGNGATAAGTNAIAQGTSATAAGTNAVAQGQQASSSGNNAVAIGQGASATGENTIAYGTGAQAAFAGSVAIGNGARAIADPTTAVGDNSAAVGNNSVALGANATANGTNSVALGQGSVANRDNSVSVGSTSQQRQITNVAPGTAGTDAVNVNQMNAAVAGVQQNLQNQINGVGAMGMAAAQIAGPAFAGKSAAGVGVAGVGNQQAIAIGISHVPKDHPNMLVRFSAAYSTAGQTAVAAGASWQF
jgi:autotransporter adhesin